MQLEEFKELVGEFINENVYPRGEEFDFSRKYNENIKELFNKVQRNNKELLIQFVQDNFTDKQDIVMSKKLRETIVRMLC